MLRCEAKLRTESPWEKLNTQWSFWSGRNSEIGSDTNQSKQSESMEVRVDSVRLPTFRSVRFEIRMRCNPLV